MQGILFLKRRAGTEEPYHARLPLSIHTPDRIVATSHSILQKVNKQDIRKNFKFEKGSRDRNKK